MICEEHDQCLNNCFCLICKDRSHLKLPKQHKKRGFANGKKQGQGFEKKVEQAYNRAKRTPASGALWGSPGDITTPNMLMEAKERTARGNGSISIHKAWLDGIQSEALEAGKPMWCLPFRFKGDGRVYAVMDFEDLASLLKSVR